MSRRSLTLFLCGDVMTGRGIDQILPHPSEPRIHEQSLHDAREYVWLAEQANGRITYPVPFAYVWGEALVELARRMPDARIANLETTITRQAEHWRRKEVCYRMHPANIACLTDARLDVCVLANNHALDYGRDGLVETLDVLTRNGMQPAGAGRALHEARQPAAVVLDGARLLVFGFASATSGVPDEWAATDAKPGLDVLPDLSDDTASEVIERIRVHRRPGDLVIASPHWGSNWGWESTDEEVRFAHRLVDGGVDLVFGHSSHHPRAIEVYQGRLILYGCGDFIDDYEGISGHEEYRDDLRLMYFPTLDATTGMLEGLTIVPLRVRRMTLERATQGDRHWLRRTLARISRPFGVDLALTENGELELRQPRRSIASVMTAPADTIAADASLEEAARRFRDAAVGMLPVVEGDDLIGVITDRDVVLRAVAEHRDPTATHVRDVMTARMVTCKDTDDVATAASLMVRNGVRRLMVLDANGRLCGVVSVDDLAPLAADLAPEEVAPEKAPSPEP